jgi:hypothetical protein
VKARINNPVLVWILIMLTVSLVTASFFINKYTRGEIVLSWQRLPVRSVIHEGGFCYLANHGRIWMSSHKRPSPARILEDGVPLGPGNAVHEDIRKIGNGRFSFWYDCLYFSSSDNSDPRSNGRKYELLWPTPVKKSLTYGLYGVSLLFTLFSCFVIIPIVQTFLNNLRYQNKSEYLSNLLRRNDVLILLNIARYLVVSILLFFVYMLLNKPEWAISISNHIFLFISIYIICGCMGFYLLLLLKTKTYVISVRSLIQTTAYLALLFYLINRPEVGIQYYDIPWLLFNIAIPFIFGVTAGLISIQLFPCANDGNVLDACINILGRWSLLPLIMSVIIVLPEVTKSLISRWDISGFMDSHMYDYYAHDIATGSVLEGSSFVMPLYQYGMGLLYFVFGHFFYIQQIVNVIMAILTTILLCLTAWNLFKNKLVVILAGVMGAYAGQLHAFVHITQIENWYLPLIALNLFAWSCYWRRPGISHLVLLALSTGMALNCRSQATVYYLLLMVTPFFITGLSLKKRFIHTFIACLVVLTTLVPWTLRNYFYEGRISPASTQTEIIYVLNNHSIPLYGVLEDNWVKYLDEYKKKYEDKDVRLRIMKNDFLKNTFSDPIWLANAVYWRAVAFYNLLPPGVWAKNGPEPTNWKSELSDYVSSRSSSLFFIGIALIGLITAPNRTTVFLFLGILTQMASIIAVPPGDSRYGYPVIPYHIILGLFAFVHPKRSNHLLNSHNEGFLFTKNRLRIIAPIIVIVVLFMLLCHINYGQYYLFRPMIEKAVVFDSSVKIDDQLPHLNDYYKWSVGKQGAAPIFKQGDRVRFKIKVTNYMLPPKTGKIVPYLPIFASDPLREIFYYGFSGEGSSGYIGVTYFGATLNSVIKENESLEGEGTVLYVDTENTALPIWFWVRVEKAVKLAN